MRRLAALLALVLAGASAAVPLLSSPAAATTASVTITSTLQPATLTVAPGTKVTWKNADGDEHRVRSTNEVNDVEFDSGNLEPGESYSFTFPTSGTWNYRDERDEDNSAYWGKIVVKSSTTTAPPSGGGGSGGSGGGSGGGGTAPAPSAPASASVSIVNKAFSPASVTVASGGKVTWSNDDDRAHTVTASGGSFDSGLLDPGQRYTGTFKGAGTVAYFCIVHPEMKGTVQVAGAGGDGATGSGSATPSGGSSGGASASPAGSTTASGAISVGPAGSPPPPDAVTRHVTIEDFAFRPASLDVRTGDSVEWSNTGASPHTVTAEAFDSGLLATGRTFDVTFREAGTYSYVCSFHPQMKGTISVSGRSLGGPAAATGTKGTDAATASDPDSTGDGAAADSAEGTGIDATPAGARFPNGLAAGGLAAAGILAATAALLHGARRLLAFEAAQR